MTLSGVVPVQRVWVDKTEEKGSDVNLAEPVRVVRQEFGMPIGILNPHQHHSVQLKSLATFLKRIRQSALLASQFPDHLVDSRGAFHKPPAW